MKVVVVGSGGREHALAVVLGRTAEVVVTPGNPLIPGSVGTDVEDLVADGSVDLVVVGPEQPLVAGLADRLRAGGVRVFGPGAEGAKLEGSKAYMKMIAEEAGLPTARWEAFTDADDAVDYLNAMKGPYVVKTDGLAAGKGVLVTDSLDDAVSDVRAKLGGDTFGESGRRVVIEEALTGPEVSVFAVCDGTRAVCLPAAQDFKRVGDGDAGLNTGGMGAWSPLPFLPDGFEEQVARDFIAPTLAELQQRGIDYRGVLYAGFILTDEGPKLLEYNVRFGDPDSQVVLLRMTSDLAGLLAAAADGDLAKAPEPTFSDDAAVLVVAASEGYPVVPRTGDAVEGLDAAASVVGVTVLGAGVGRRLDGTVTTAGGRVLNVVGIGATTDDARSKAYGALGRITWPGEHHRTDIAASPA
ncbi:MAG TPA: phosphoribosylamine--glycine ligase [Acidimicrobiales bacterium]|nr:phosphoribosylamine--glycine ligase [Acidimicrobiales bacterium]